jgi:uncharacterized protein YaeQ
MAIGATMSTFDVQLADVDRGVYEEFTLRVAQHPSETDTFLLTRVLAYCLEFEQGIAFSEGISATDEPAVLVRDDTGRLTAWIEVGAPDAERMHLGSRLADRATVYTHRDPVKVIAAWSGKRIHEVDRIVVHALDAAMLEDAARVRERRNALTVSVIERRLYLDLNGTSLDGEIRDLPAAG